MPIPDSVLKLAGFTLAQAVRDISRLSLDDALCAFTVVEANGAGGADGTRSITRFEDSKHPGAPTGSGDTIASATKSGHAWAFARESSVEGQGGSEVDAIAVDFWAAGMESPATLVQRFETAGGRGGVHLIGEPEIAPGPMVKTPDEADDLVRIIKRGMM